MVIRAVFHTGLRTSSVRTATWQGTHQSAQSPFHSMSCSAFSSPNLSSFSSLVFECLFMMSSMSNMFMCNALSLLCIADDMLRNHKQNGDSDVSSSIDAVSWNSDSHCCKRERTLQTPWTDKTCERVCSRTS